MLKEIITEKVEIALGLPVPPRPYLEERPKKRQVIYDETDVKQRSSESFQELIHGMGTGKERGFVTTFFDLIKNMHLGVNPFVYGVETLEFTGNWRLATRRVNGWKSGLLYNREDPSIPSKSGLLFSLVYNNKGDPHSHDHYRRDLKFIKSEILKDRSLRHGSEAIPPWLLSMIWSGDSHDLGQGMVELENKFHLDEKEWLDAKAGHGWEGGLLAVLTSDIMQFEGQVGSGVYLERQITAKLLSDILHTEPRKLAKRLVATTKANDILPVNNSLIKQRLTNKLKPEKVKELWQLWNQSAIDPLSLTIPHALLLMWYEKFQAKSLYSDSHFGFHPFIEKEYRDQILKAFSDFSTLEEKLYLRGGEDRQQLNRGIEVVIKADTKEMVKSTMEALVRLLKVQRSMKRPFWREEIPIERLVKLATTDESGNFKKGTETDMLRFFWEAIHFGGKDVLAKMIEMRELGSQIMSGDLSPLKTVYKKRLQEVNKKAIREILRKMPDRQRLSGRNYLKQLQKDGSFNSLVGQIELLLDQYQIDKTYLQTIKAIQKEEVDIVTNLSNKPDGAVGEVKQYSEEAIQHFKDFADQCIDFWIAKEKIPPSEVRRLINKLNEGALVDKAPFRADDSIAHPNNAKTYIARDFVAARAQEMIAKGLITLQDLYDGTYIAKFREYAYHGRLNGQSI